jgi:hypothetical protein
MKRVKQLKKAYGTVENGTLVDFPAKTSNVQVARTIHCKKQCTYCFPHGCETHNSTVANQQRSWKRFRQNQWRK